MTAEEIVSTYQKLDQNQQQRFLANLAFQLTILARFAYEVGTEGISRLALIRSVNEMQHRLLATLASHIEADEERFPDDVLFNGMVDEAHTQGFREQFEFAINNTIKRIG